MGKYILKRLLQSIIVLILISIISFLIIYLAPGSPIGNTLNPKVSPEVLEKMRKAYNLDKPWWQQYFLWVEGLFTGKLRSIKTDEKVFDAIGRRIGNTLMLNVVAMIIIFCIAIPLGVYSATHRYSPMDHATTILAYIGISIPSFSLAYLFLLPFIKIFKIPILGNKTFGLSPEVGVFGTFADMGWHLIIPAFILAIASIAVLSRYMRASMLEVKNQDYIRTAYAKGLDPDTVNYKHALKNALLPFITIFGFMIPGLISGSVIIESIFAWPGIGRLAYSSVLARDYPVIMTLNLIGAVLVLFGNFVADILYRLADPRIQLK